MKATLSFRAVGLALAFALVVSYVLCILADLVLGWEMYRAWAPLLPGFAWPLTVGGFVVGLVESILYGFYAAPVFVLPYNYLVQREPPASMN